MNNYFIFLNKKEDQTSFFAINELKKEMNISKVGHCGTLDPFATGLLIIGTNKATKLLSLLVSKTKEYEGIIKLGSQTETYDFTGKETNKKSVEVTQEKINKVIQNNFLGEQLQTPPIFSALKVKGKRLYQYARENKEIPEIAKREITIYAFETKLLNKTEIYFKIKVSSGTYIRSIANDLAIALNTYGHLLELNRTKIDEFHLKRNQNLEIKSIEEMFPEIEFIEINDELYNDVKNGKTIKIDSKYSNKKSIFIKKNNQVFALLKKVENDLWKNHISLWED